MNDGRRGAKRLKDRRMNKGRERNKLTVKVDKLRAEGKTRVKRKKRESEILREREGGERAD